LSLPAVINRDGVVRVLPIQLSPEERRALEASAKVLKEHVAAVDGSISTFAPEHENLDYPI